MPSMKEVEHAFKDQQRWNQAYGTSNLQRIEERPADFIVDAKTLWKPKVDLIDAMGDLQGKTILEFGSGRGELAVLMARRGARVVGVDIGEDLVELSRRVAEINGVECKFIVGSVHDVPFEEEAFNFVMGTAILHHLPQQGVAAAVDEAYRVLKPGGEALFAEPIENSKLFDLLQSIVPVGKPGSPQYRPSLVQRKKWKQFLAESDDRLLTTGELRQAGRKFAEVRFSYYGMLVRLRRLWSHPGFERLLMGMDRVLTHDRSPIKKLSQSVLVTYKKP